MPDPPEILPSFVSSVTAIEGNDVLLNCSAVGNPTPRVTWWRGTEELLGVLSNGSILLSSVQTNNEGNYTCRAANSLGLIEATLSLIIQGESLTRTFCVIRLIGSFKGGIALIE